MPTRKIADLPRPCRHPEHDPPRHMVYEDGVYEHTCPKCGASQTFEVSKPNLGLATFALDYGYGIPWFRPDGRR